MSKILETTHTGLQYPTTAPEAGYLLLQATRDLGYPPSYADWARWVRQQPELSSTCATTHSPALIGDHGPADKWRWARAYTAHTYQPYHEHRQRAEARQLMLLGALALRSGRDVCVSRSWSDHVEAAYPNGAPQVRHLRAGVASRLRRAGVGDAWYTHVRTFAPALVVTWGRPSMEAAVEAARAPGPALVAGESMESGARDLLYGALDVLGGPEEVVGA